MHLTLNHLNEVDKNRFVILLGYYYVITDYNLRYNLKV